uniref:Leucine-rich repeat-containing protein 51 n=1 Tax=Ornithorhynchus anatinus TaxID=9258 RepID=F7CZP1_ORNAN
MVSEEPREGPRPLRRSPEGKALTQALRLNNNALSDMNDLSQTLTQLLERPQDLAWIDLSFNDLSNIDPILTAYSNLSIIYLHGNCIQRLGEVDKLAALPLLRSLTLHGNPIQEQKGYRQYVLSALPHLTTFDFSGVTGQDRATALLWKQMNHRPKKVKIKHPD